MQLLGAKEKIMLIEKYEPTIKKYTCVSSKFNWFFLTGTGSTPEDAQKDMFLKHAEITKNRTGYAVINTNCA